MLPSSSRLLFKGASATGSGQRDGNLPGKEEQCVQFQTVEKPRGQDLWTVGTIWDFSPGHVHILIT